MDKTSIIFVDLDIHSYTSMNVNNVLAIYAASVLSSTLGLWIFGVFTIKMNIKMYTI